MTEISVVIFGLFFSELRTHVQSHTSSVLPRVDIHCSFTSQGKRAVLFSRCKKSNWCYI